MGGDTKQQLNDVLWSISIHTTRVGGDCYGGFEAKRLIISIHTTRVGGDRTKWVTMTVDSEFQSTPPVWVVTLSRFHLVCPNR